MEVRSEVLLEVDGEFVETVEGLTGTMMGGVDTEDNGFAEVDDVCCVEIGVTDIERGLETLEESFAVALFACCDEEVETCRGDDEGVEDFVELLVSADDEDEYVIERAERLEVLDEAVTDGFNVLWEIVLGFLLDRLDEYAVLEEWGVEYGTLMIV